MIIHKTWLPKQTLQVLENILVNDNFEATIHQFAEQGEKTGWTFIRVPADIALALKPGNKRSFRVKGYLDHFSIQGVALLPGGDGSFIMPFNAEMRKGTRKSKGAMVNVSLQNHHDYKIEIPDDLQECFDYEEPEALAFFNSLTRSHRDYFIKWITGAKTDTTRATRIVNTVNAAVRKMGYTEMMRDLKARK